MDLISEYIGAVCEIDELRAAGLDNRNAVKQNNSLADRLREIAAEIECSHPELKADFRELLSHERASVRLWSAHHILEVMNCGNECRKRALKEISSTAEHDAGITGLGNRMWLDRWLAQHPTDRELL